MFTVSAHGNDLHNNPSAFVVMKDDEVRGIVHVNPHDPLGLLFARKDAERLAEKYNSGEMYEYF